MSIAIELRVFKKKKKKNMDKVGKTFLGITGYGSTLYIGIAMVVCILPIHSEIQFLLSLSSHFNV